MNQLISDVFGDPVISLECGRSGECIHSSQVPGYQPPETPSFSFAAIGIMVLIAVSIIFGLFFLLNCTKDADEMEGHQRLISEQEREDEQQRLRSHHVPCTLTYRDISYRIDKRPSIFKRKLIRSGSGRLYEATEADEEIGLQTSENADSNTARLPQKQAILEGIKGIVKPGEVLAIMGGSGAGKTTFLDILARKNKSGTVKGEIRVNGRLMSKNEYRSIIG